MAAALLAVGALLTAPPASAQGTSTMTLTKSGPTTPQAPGTQFTYYLSYACSSLETDCPLVTIKDVLPIAPGQLSGAEADVTLIGDAKTVRTTYDPATGTATFEQSTPTTPVPAGSTGQVAIEVQFPPNITPVGASVTNTASISFCPESLNPDGTCPTSLETVTSNPVTVQALVTPGIAATKVLSTSPFIKGLPATYTVTWRNTGNVDLTDPTLVDTLPAGVTCAMVSDISNNSPAPGTMPVCHDATPNSTITWTMAGPASPSATPNFTQTFAVTYPLGFPTPITNRVTASGIPLGETAPITNEAETTDTPAVPAPGLTAAKSPNGETFFLNTDVTYTVSVHNSGDVTLNGVTMVDTLQDGLTCADVVTPIPGGGTCDSNTDEVTWGSTTLAPNASFQQTLTVRYSPPTFRDGQTVDNTVAGSGTAVTGGTVEATPVTVSNTLRAAAPSLTASKSPNGETFVLNTDVTYTVSVHNSGDVSLNDVTMVDTLENGLTCDDVVTPIPGGGTCNSGTTPNEVTWGPTTLAPNTSFQQTLTVRYSPPTFRDGQTIDNTVAGSGTAVTGGTVEATPVTVSNTLRAPAAGEITVEKAPNNTEFVAGQPVDYAVTVRHTGEAGSLPLTNFTVTDPLLNGLTCADVVPDSISNGGTCDSNAITWTFATLGPGQSQEVTFSVVYPLSTPSGQVENCATVTGTFQGNEETFGPGCTTGNTVRAPATGEITVEKAPNNTEFVAGQPANYTVTVRHTGEAGSLPLTNFTVTDPLLNGLTCADVVPDSISNGGTCDSNAITWTFATLGPGQSQAVTFSVIYPLSTPAGPVENCATVTGTFQGSEGTFGPGCTTDNTVRAPAPGQITIEKAPNDTQFVAGQPVTYTVTVRHTGEVGSLPLTNFTVTDPLSDGLTCADVVSDSISNGGTCDSNSTPNQITWTFPSLGPGQSQEVTFRVVYPLSTPPGSVQNCATVTGTFQASEGTFGPGCTTGNTVVAPRPEATIRKDTSATTVQVGSTFTYTVNVQNTGNVPLTNMVVTDSIPPQTQFAQGVNPNLVFTDTADGSASAATFEYFDSATGQWVPVPTGTAGVPSRSCANGICDVFLPATATGIRITYVPRPPGFMGGTPATLGSTITMTLQVPPSAVSRSGAGILNRQTFQNCATVSADELATTEEACAPTQTVTEPPPTMTLSKTRVTPTGPAPPPSRVTFDLVFAVPASSPSPAVNPTVTDCLPSGQVGGVQVGLDLVDPSNPSDSANWSTTFSPGPTSVERVPGGGGCAADQIAVIFSWAGAGLSVAPGTSGTITLITVLQPGTPTTPQGTPLINSATAIAENNTTPTPPATATVAVASGASLDSIKLIKGSLDQDYSKYPNVGKTTFAGSVLYRIQITNSGNVPIDQITAIDILPFVGDTAVLNIGIPRGSQWSPILTGQVEAPDGVTVLYSTSTNPCRPELNYNPPDCVSGSFSDAPPGGDFSAVRSLEFQYPAALAPGHSLQINWPMVAPANVVPGEVAWNSFAYTGFRTDISGAAGQLPPAEPNKVGIEILPYPLQIQKLVNESSQPAAPGLPIFIGQTVTYTYLVTNPGELEVTNLHLFDDPAQDNITCDVPDVGIVPAAQATIAPHTTLMCTADAGPAVLGLHTDTACVTGQPVVDGTPEAPTDEVCDTANYTGTPAETSLTTQVMPSATVAAGTAIHDTATLVGSHAPTGEVTFHLYGPFAAGSPATCTGTPVTSTGRLSGTPGTASSESVTPTVAGSYFWTASYPGDANNQAASSTCGAANEETTVTAAETSLTTRVMPSATVAAGTAIHDTATLVGSHAPTGEVTFHLYGPFAAGSPATCTGTPVTSTGSLSGTPGTASSESFTPTVAGSYFWTASYPGDANNQAASSTCGAANEETTVTAAETSLTTRVMPSATVAAGTAIHDTATLVGSHAPTGEVTFHLYGPFAAGSPATCTGTPVTSTGSLSGTPGTASSESFTPTVAGSYFWTASYPGDANNQAASSTCGAANEETTVTAAETSLTTRVMPSATVAAGTAIHDTATLVGSHAPTGEVTFHLYGPFAAGSPATCTGTPVTSTGRLSGTPGTASSESFTPTVAGSYFWTASYPGDANNQAASSTCGAANEETTVTAAETSLTTRVMPSATVAAGTAIHDTATLVGSHAPTGEVTFHLYGPFAAGSPATCTGTPVTSTGSLSGTPGTASSESFTPTVAGSYFWTASYPGDANNQAASSTCGAANEETTVTAAETSLTTRVMPSATVAAGTAIHDTATLVGSHAPTGEVTFHLYGPFAAGSPATCTGTPVTSTGRLSGTPGTASSESFTPTVAGSYFWTASYPGDDNNQAASSTCGAANEETTVTAAETSLTTRVMPSATVAAGTAIHDTATLVGSHAPTGEVTFHLYGPFAAGSPATCTGTPVTSTGRLSGTPGTASSESFTPTVAGSYFWTASYPGDANNQAASSTCGAANEETTVTAAETSLTTQVMPSATVAAGTAIHDTATLVGSHAPTGEVTFHLYGPFAAGSPATCTGTPVTSTGSLSGTPGTASSESFTPTVAGSYFWTASYPGDANNQAASSTCGAANEETTVTAAETSLTTDATPSATVGTGIQDTATLHGAQAPTGEVTFTLFGTPNCAPGSDVFTSVVAISSTDGTASSESFTPTVAGSYFWTASYPGDANNLPASSPCRAPNETTVVSAAVSPPGTPAPSVPPSAGVPGLPATGVQSGPSGLGSSWPLTALLLGSVFGLLGLRWTKRR